MMSGIQRISIVTSTANGGHFLQACLSSILSQRSDRLQYIVADDAGSDESSLILQQYRSQLDALVIDCNRSQAATLNKAFALSDGHIMGWINSDDILLGGTLETVFRIFDERPDVEWITGRATSIDENGNLISMEAPRPRSRLRFLSGDHLGIQQASTFWRRSLWERAGAKVDEQLDIATDFDLWARFFREAELHTVDRHLGSSRVHDGLRSVMRSDKYRYEINQILRRELDALDPQLRKGAGRIIPDRPRTLSPNERNVLEPQLRLLDPALIHPTQPALNLPASLGKTPASGDALRLYSKSDMSKFKDRHKGERCFIMGNGPSLREMDLSKLKGETVFACNLIYLMFGQLEWRPTYYSCVDTRMLIERHEEIRKMLDAEPDIQAFFPTRLEEHSGGRRKLPMRAFFGGLDRCAFFDERHPTQDDPPFSMFSLDIDNWVAQPQTVSITLLQLAAYMGFSEIILIGCDTRYTLPPSLQIKNGEFDKPGLDLVSTRDDDPNHFSPTYFGTGQRWNAPNIPKIIEQYTAARDALATAGIAVYNATIGGILEVFTRVDYDDLFFGPIELPNPAANPVRAGVKSRSPTSDNLKSGRLATALAITRRNRPMVAGLVAALLAIICAALLAPSWLWIGAIASLGGLGILGGLGFFAILKVRKIITSQDARIRQLEASYAKTEMELAKVNEHPTRRDIEES